MGLTVHSGSHRGLLTSVPDEQPAGYAVDAIIVPSIATPPYLLRHAVSLAGQLRCPLVVLCSRLGGRHGAGRIAEESTVPVDLVAIDIPAWLEPLLPRFETTEMLCGGRFERKADTALKRNIGLAL